MFQAHRGLPQAQPVNFARVQATRVFLYLSELLVTILKASEHPLHPEQLSTAIPLQERGPQSARNVQPYREGSEAGPSNLVRE